MIPVIEWDVAAYQRKFVGTWVWLTDEKNKPFFAHVDDISGHSDAHCLIAFTEGPNKYGQGLLRNGCFHDTVVVDDPVYTIMYAKPYIGIFKRENITLAVSRKVEKVFKQGFCWGNPFSLAMFGGGNGGLDGGLGVLQHPTKSRFHITDGYIYYLDLKIGIVNKKENRVLVDNERLRALVKKEFPQWTVEA